MMLRAESPWRHIRQGEHGKVRPRVANGPMFPPTHSQHGWLSWMEDDVFRVEVAVDEAAEVTALTRGP